MVVPLAVLSATAAAGGGPLGIDHRLQMDNDGIWLRGGQKSVMYGMAAVVIGGGLWEGGDTRLGKTFWQSIDATAAGSLSSEGLKRTFTRMRPSETDDPNRWFQGGSNRSFPSGEVTAVSAMVTPFVLEYRHDYPAVYALELLPAYDAMSRMRTHGHWQTDVLAGFALGTAAGYVAHSLDQPITIRALPHGLAVGLKMQF